ncbi:unnamed protein product, partial [Strongylus vulgaris]
TRRGSSIVSSTEHTPLSRDFVYTLHHNFKSCLLYGKNNVGVANGDAPAVKDDTSPSTLTLVNCDGVQCPPLQMSAGQHSLVFLTSLEAGLAPTHRLDPPLWGGPGKGNSIPSYIFYSLKKGNL